MSAVFVELGSVAEFINGAPFKPEDWGDSGARIIRIQNLTDPSRPFNRTKRTVEEKLRVRPGDLLVSWSATLGVFEWSGLDEALLNQHIFRVVPDGKKVEKSYLRHALEGAILDMQPHLHGATMQHVNRGEFLGTKLFLPPLAEQRRIAEVLDRAEGLRAKRRNTLAQLDTLTQSIFLDLFGDPVVNQKGWDLKKLGDVGTIDRGVSKHRPRNAPQLLGGSYPLVQTGDVAKCDGYIRSYMSTYSDIGLRQSKLWPAGTLCITIAANIAKTGILRFDACFPDSIVGFRAEDPATVEYVRIWLSFLQKALEDRAPESAQKNINLAILRDISLPLPPLPLRKLFSRHIAAIEKVKAAHRISLTRLDTLFASLHYRAFRGELVIDVPPSRSLGKAVGDGVDS